MSIFLLIFILTTKVEYIRDNKELIERCFSVNKNQVVMLLKNISLVILIMLLTNFKSYSFFTN